MAYKDGVIQGPVILNNSGSGNTTIGAGTNSGTVTFGNGSSGAVTVDCGTAGLVAGTTANAHTTTLGSTNSTSSTTVQSGSGALNVTATNGPIALNSGTATLNVSTDPSATTVNIAMGAGSKTLTIGSTNSTSSTTFDVGSGGLNVPDFTEGAVVVDATTAVFSTNDTAGYVLTSNGTGLNPTFKPLSGGTGGIVYITQNNFSSVSSTEFDSTYITNAYTSYFILLNNIEGVDFSDFVLTISDDDGSTYKTSNYEAGYFYTAGTSTQTNAGSTAGFLLQSGSTEDFTQFNGYLYIHNLATSSNPSVSGQIVCWRNAGTLIRGQVYGNYYGSALTTNNIKFSVSAGTISRTIILYGMTT